MRGSTSSSFGPSTPTQTVTIRPRESKVTDAQTPSRNVERFVHLATERPRALVDVGLVAVDVQVASGRWAP